jgi:RimJ/RimL family protein N-acetyltransferase
VTSNQPIVNIVGERVALGPTRRDVMVPLLQRWFNDFEVMRNWVELPNPRTDDSIGGLYDRVIVGERAASFTLYELASWQPVGITGLIYISHLDRTAECWIMIGEPEATRLVLDYAFTALGLRNVMLEVWEFNLVGVRAYERAGFREIGLRRRSKFMGGRMWDRVLMDAIPEEFESPVLGRVLIPDRPRD